MSQENVEITRAMYEAFSREGAEGVVVHLARDSRFYPFPGWPGDPVYHGPDGFLKLAAEWSGSFEDYRWEMKEFLDAGDSVVMLAVHSGRMPGTGLLVRTEVSLVARDFRPDGTVGEIRYFQTPDEAKRAAGI